MNISDTLPPFPALVPALYIVSVPIGNLRDITLRALETLGSVDYIFCEDTRTTRALCKKYGIASKRCLSYHDHSDAERRNGLLSYIHNGFSAALVSDAGTPAIADPGFKLIRAAIEEHIRVIPVPGVCAATAALTVSGLPTDRYSFEGFLPQKKTARLIALKEKITSPASLIFYEAPHRLEACLHDIASIDPTRPVCVARELTKRYEEIARGTAEHLAADFASRDAIKGECVLIVGGKPVTADVSGREDAVKARLRELLPMHKTKDAAAIVAKETDIPPKQLYKLALSIISERGVSRKNG